MFRSGLALSIFVVLTTAFAADPPSFLRPSEESLEGVVSPDALRSEIESRRERVKFFNELRAIAEKQGVRLWLLGGAASQFGHYVRWDMLREAGDKNFRGNKFNYDHVQIFRAGQDFDLVIDGNEADAKAVEKALARKFSKLRFDVSLLKEKREKHLAILGDDFLSQISDTHSMGMLELTRPAAGESIVRSANDWNNQKAPPFLDDMANARIRFMPNGRHSLSSRYIEGMNPPLLPVIRYLIKALSLGLKIPEESYRELRASLEQPQTAHFKEKYIEGWLERNIQKLVMRSFDHSRTISILNDLGLRVQLGRHNKEISKLLGRKPLADRPFSSKFDPALLVAHDTTSYEAYDSMAGTPCSMCVRHH